MFARGARDFEVGEAEHALGARVLPAEIEIEARSRRGRGEVERRSRRGRGEIEGGSRRDRGRSSGSSPGLFRSMAAAVKRARKSNRKYSFPRQRSFR